MISPPVKGVVSQDHLDTVNALSVHPASQVMLTKNCPLVDQIGYSAPPFRQRNGLLTVAQFGLADVVLG
jgi:hypothetical protein